MFIIIVNKKDLYSIHWYLEAEKKKKNCTELASSSQENMKKERNCGNINKLNLEKCSHSPYQKWVDLPLHVKCIDIMMGKQKNFLK